MLIIDWSPAGRSDQQGVGSGRWKEWSRHTPSSTIASPQHLPGRLRLHLGREAGDEVALAACVAGLRLAA
jgi:hypothetical protein